MNGRMKKRILVLAMAIFLAFGAAAIAANVKISELPEQTSINNADYIPNIDTSVAPITKRVTWRTIKSFLEDYFDVMYDATGTASSAVSAHDADTGAHSGTFDAAGTAASVVSAHDSDSGAHSGTFELSGAVSTHNSSSTAHDFSAWSTCTPTVTCVGGTGNVVPEYETSTCYYRKEFGSYHVRISLGGDGGNEGSGTGLLHVALPVQADAGNDGSIIPAGVFNLGYAYPAAGSIASSATTIGFSANVSGSMENLACYHFASSWRDAYLEFWYK